MRFLVRLTFGHMYPQDEALGRLTSGQTSHQVDIWSYITLQDEVSGQVDIWSDFRSG